MAEQKRKSEDLGQAEVQQKVDEATRKGYVGSVPDQPANEEYSLATGPDAPDESQVAAKKRGA